MNTYQRYTFVGICGHCDRKINHSRIIPHTEQNTEEWVFCDDCDRISKLTKASSKRI